MAGYIGTKAVLLSTTAATVTGNATFGDNNKAIFGAGSDLQIYHDGSQSVISDEGTGQLLLKGSNTIAFTTAADAPLLRLLTGGAAEVFYNGSQKLATTSTGVDVTGTVTADGLTVGAGGDIEIAGGQNIKTLGTMQIAADYDGSGAGVLRLRTNALTRQQIDNNGDISFYEDTGTTPKFFWDASAEALGIGTSSPQTNMHIQSAGDTGIQITKELSVAGRVFTPSGALAFGVDTSNGTTERMRIDTSGRVLVGITSPLPNRTQQNIQAKTAGFTSDDFYNGLPTLFLSSLTDTTGGLYLEIERSDGTRIGSITRSGSASVAYNTSSDYRLKEDWQPMTGASDRVLALNPVNFAWKADGTRVDGFLAHEAQEVVPEAVHGVKDGMRTEEYEVTPAVYDDEGNLVSEAVMGTREVPDYQGIDQSKLVPLLTAALQEALTEIASLKARLDAANL